MTVWRFCILSLVCSLHLGCKKADPPPAAEPAPEAAKTATEAAPTATPATAEPAVPAGAVDAAPAGAEAPSGEPPKAAGTVVLAAPPTGDGATPEEAVGVPLPALPPPPDDNVLIVARHASVNCPDRKAPCEARSQLAAKIPSEVEQVQELLKKGTDQEKVAIHDALLLVRDEAADLLLAAIIMDSSGATDPDVAAHVAALRSVAALPAIVERLPKSNTDETVLLLDTLGAIGGDAATKALTEALSNEALSPFWGDVCRNLARVNAEGAFDRIVSVGNRVGATSRQSEGCRAAESAFRMQKAAGGLALNINGQQLTSGAVLVWQQQNNPSVVTAVFTKAADATCEVPGEEWLRFDVPLSRAAEPLLGAGVRASLHHGDKSFGHAPVYHFRFDTFAFQKGSELTGWANALHLKGEGEPRIIVSGPFAGRFCGAR